MLKSYTSWPSNTHWIGDIGNQIYMHPQMVTGASFGGISGAMYGSGVSNILLEGINFASSKTALIQSNTVGFLHFTGLRIRECSFRNVGNATYYAQRVIALQTKNIEISNSTFDSCSGDGMALSNSCSNYFIRNNVFSSNGDWGCTLVEGSNYGAVEGNLFLNNVSSATGVYRCSFVQFTGNTMLSNEHGVRICEFAVSSDKSENFTITGNNIKQSYFSISVENMKAPMETSL